MKAMIFAAGLGTRLRPLTDNCPKALIEVNGRPILERVIVRLIEAGVTEMVINVHYLGRMIKDFLEVNDNFGITIHVSDETDLLLDTGGAVLKAREWLEGEDPFIIHNADILTDIDLKSLMREHTLSGAAVTLLVARRSTSRYLLFDHSMRLEGWTNVKSGETVPPGMDVSRYEALAFGGIHVFSPSLFPSLEAWSEVQAPGLHPFPIIPFYIHEAQKSLIRGYAPQGFKWLDIGRPETLAQASELFI